MVDADIKGLLDNIDHKWMMKFLEHRNSYVNEEIKTEITYIL